MTADIATQTKSNPSGSLIPTLALAFATLTLILAALSMVFGNRLVTLQHSQREAAKEAALSEETAVERMQTTITTIQQQLEAEKATTAKLRTQITTANKALKKTKAELATAKQTIESLKPAPADLPVSSPEATPPSETAATPAPAAGKTVSSGGSAPAPVTAPDTTGQETAPAPPTKEKMSSDKPLPSTTPSGSTEQKAVDGKLSEESIGMKETQTAPAQPAAGSESAE
jgi:hypothetical protein